jgi:SAM-dependent methyltransferase
LRSVTERYADYLASDVSSEISPFDDMFVSELIDDYMAVGRSAIQSIADAMILSEVQKINTVLDYPCGGGRVSRHLVKFFPNAELFAADINPAKEEFVVQTFGATRIQATADFSISSSQKFDLIFVGSLVTHFGATQFARAMNWFIDSLAPNGLLVITTHGRRTAFIFRDFFSSPERRQSRDDFLESGFGYQPDESAMSEDGPQSYGGSLSAPSWVMRLVEEHRSVRIVSFKEAAWADNHDVLVLQRKPVEA